MYTSMSCEKCSALRTADQRTVAGRGSVAILYYLTGI